MIADELSKICWEYANFGEDLIPRSNYMKQESKHYLMDGGSELLPSQ